MTRDRSIRRIYFDANVLRGRWPGRLARDLQILVRLSRLAEVQLCVPQTVAIEHKHSTIRHVIESVKKAGSELRKANTWLNGVVEEFPLPTISPAVVGQAHDEAVAREQESNRFCVIPATSKSLADFVEFAASHTPPFKDEDRGFRDAAHLHSVVDHLQAEPLQTDEEALFVTADKAMSPAVSLMTSAAELRTVDLSEAIESVLSVLTIDESELWDRLVREWAPEVERAAREDLMPHLVVGLERNEVVFDVTLSRLTNVKVIRTDESEAAAVIAPNDQDRPESGFSMVVPVILMADAVITRPSSPLRGAVLGVISGGTIEAHISLIASIASDSKYNMKSVLFEGAQLDWLSVDGGEPMSTGSPAVELL